MNEKNWAFIIYCRKSTDESSEQQKQSIPDQIRACVEYAKRENIEIMKKPSDFSFFESEMDIYKEDNDSDLMNRKIHQETRDLFIVKEQETGKVPYKRKKWRKIIDMVNKWKIGWILSYSPDRQARNMLEWWELINLVDVWSVDLKYTNFHFENTASGKMMLGIWFVFSKQYSDKLSEDVTRWNTRQIEWGKAIGKPKAGYRINAEGFHEPDPINFPLIQEAFERKLNGETDEEITNFLNTNGYKRVLKSGKWELEMSAKNIYRLWIDEFYYGILVYGNTVTDVREYNPYYKPVITEEQHIILKERYNERGKILLTQSKTYEEFDEIKPFDNGFIRTEDNHSLTFSLPNKKRFYIKLDEARKSGKKVSISDFVDSHQIWYRCGNKHSKDYNLQVTAEEVEKAVMDKLSSFHLTPEHFEKYREYGSSEIKRIGKDSMERIASKQLELNRLKSERNKYIDSHMSLKKDTQEEEIYEKKKLDFENKINLLKKEMDNLDESERNEIFEIESLMKILIDTKGSYKKASFVQKNKLVKILFSNIVVDHQKRLHINVKPWLESLFTLNGADNGTRTHNSRHGKAVL